MQVAEVTPTEAVSPVEENALRLNERGEIKVPEAEPEVQVEAAAIDARQEGIALIERAQGLPAVLRERLMVAVRAEEGGDGARVSLAAVIEAVEGVLPGFLRGGVEGAPAGHPSGEAFFSGAAGELSDHEAEALAQQQLQRAGLLRGQRVRSANDE